MTDIQVLGHHTDLSGNLVTNYRWAPATNFREVLSGVKVWHSAGTISVGCKKVYEIDHKYCFCKTNRFCLF